MLILYGNCATDAASQVLGLGLDWPGSLPSAQILWTLTFSCIVPRLTTLQVTASFSRNSQVGINWLWLFLSECLSDSWKVGGGFQNPVGSEPMLLI